MKIQDIRRRDLLRVAHLFKNHVSKAVDAQVGEWLEVGCLHQDCQVSMLVFKKRAGESTFRAASALLGLPSRALAPAENFVYSEKIIVHHESHHKNDGPAIRIIWVLERPLLIIVIIN